MGKSVSLLPLDESHFETLTSLSKDQKIWQHYAIDGSNTQKLKSSLELTLSERENGTQYPFEIVSKSENQIVGSTRFLDIEPIHKKLEIGWTWLHPDN